MATKKTRKIRIPSLRECNGRACADFKGRRIYFGKAGSREAEAKYQRTVAEYVDNGGSFPPERGGATIAELILAYWRDRKEYFRKPDGSFTSSLECIRQALKPLRDLYADCFVDDFGAGDLRAIRKGWIDRGLSRKTINHYTSALKHLFKWGVSHELVEASVYLSLATVEGLRAGRSEAKETPKRTSVKQSDINTIRPHVSRQVWAMVQVQLLTGARPGEIVNLRPTDIDRKSKPWSARIIDHKTGHKGKERVIHFGPKAQAILRPFMVDRKSNSYMFSPKDAVREYADGAKSHRRINQKPNSSTTQRTLGDHYTTDSYRKAIQRACKKAGITAWTPHRLRHTAATNFREKFGLEATSAFLGHAKVDMTQHYAEFKREKVTEAMKEFG